MSLSDRLRPDVEASPWVIKEVKKLEEELDAAWMALGLVQKENARLREALSGLLSRSREYADDYDYPENDNYTYWTEVARAALRRKE